jgi:hypothetical protein
LGTRLVDIPRDFAGFFQYQRLAVGKAAPDKALSFGHLEGIVANNQLED